MKISKLFHWLYASIMMLPLVVIPIFAIYSQRHEINDYTVENEIVKEIDFNQLQVKPLNASTEYFYENNSILTYDGNNFVFTMNAFNSNGNVNSYPCRVSTIANHIYLYSISINSYSLNTSVYVSGVNNNPTNINVWQNIRNIVSNTSEIVFYIMDYNNDNFGNIYFNNLMVIDLTQMFGSGNEPTIQLFNEWYPDDYYEYTTSRKELLYTGQYDTLNDTDIGSQFIYQLYNVTNNYFNIKDWMNLGGLFNWFLLNIFNASNSLIIPIIFNLIVYWLMISFLWLIFDILMYVPSIIHKMLDKARME